MKRRADSIHKMQVVLKEIREARYGFRLDDRAGLPSQRDARPLIDEADQLARIMAKSVVTAKSKSGRP